MWGTLKRCLFIPLKYRFIPTGVGNTQIHQPTDNRTSVHPHWCGEHNCTLLKTLCSDGSSPLVWGTRNICQPEVVNTRFIPTGVGNTIEQLNNPVPPKGSSPLVWGTLLHIFFLQNRYLVHPHWCGEHQPGQIYDSNRYGSSPLVWGTRIKTG